ncbi:hypothetical protein DINO107042_06685 [Dichelobacter nodosus]|uniref:Uncharacterized protein n=2 Tax=Dichelobacter nodosus TaxID=870 RepID=A5EV21_DICNV|nr:hypothetical protein DNO_0715 [Dichelobacter nodosus VCS1703A]AXM45579.1 hypothetical protein DYQ38_03540 [Dichelobacter nodosus]KNZ38938.1 hypothetical protein AKG33_06935 [Dichelobacter nodosus]
MDFVERLRIDELRRIEKQITVFLKSWRKMNKDLLALNEQNAALSRDYAQLKEAHEMQIKTVCDEHESALERVKTEWQQKYDADMVAIKTQLDNVEHDWQQKVAALQADLEEERRIKNVMMARIRGVEV